MFRSSSNRSLCSRLDSLRAPHLAPDVFGRCGIIGFLELHVTVAMHTAQRFHEHRKQTRWQRLQGGSFHLFKEFTDLSARGAMDARVGDVLFPVGKMTVLRRQTLEAPSLDRVVLGKLHTRLHFSFVAGHGGFGR